MELAQPAMLDDGDRPTAAIPAAQLVRLSLYWLGLSSIFTGLTAILSGRIQFDGLGERGSEGTTLFALNFTTFYLAQTFALSQADTVGTNVLLLAGTVLGNVGP